MKTQHVMFPALLITSLLGTSCGSQLNNTPAADTTTSTAALGVDAGTAALVDDEELAGDSIGVAVDEAIGEAVAGEDGSATAGFGLLGVDKTTNHSRFRSCKASDDGSSAVVTLKRGIEREVSVTKLQRSGDSSFKNLSEETRTWSKAGGKVTCDATGTFVSLARADMQGIKLKVDFKEERSRSASYKNERRGVELKRSSSSTSTGSRDITWTKVEASGSNLLLTRTLISKVERSVKTTNKKGEEKSFTSLVQTPADAPLVVTVERESKSDKIVSRTILSGKKIATNKEGGRIETTFSNVKYLPKDRCYATSGTITGSIFAKDATVATATFTIDFSGDTKSVVITNKDGSTKEVDYVADGCAMEKDEADGSEGAATEASSAAAVKISA